MFWVKYPLALFGTLRSRFKFQDSYAPKEIEGLPVGEFKALSCGAYHSAALTGMLFF